MNFVKKNWSGILVCLVIAIPSWFLGKIFPVVGGEVIAIIAGMIVTMFWNDKGKAEAEIKWTSKIILQTAVVFFFNVIAAIITTLCVHMGVSAEVFQPIKELSKFMIIMAMAAIGLNSNVIQLVKTGEKPIVVGASCWCGITIVSLIMQHIMKIW